MATEPNYYFELEQKFTSIYAHMLMNSARDNDIFFVETIHN